MHVCTLASQGVAKAIWKAFFNIRASFKEEEAKVSPRATVKIPADRLPVKGQRPNVVRLKGGVLEMPSHALKHPFVPLNPAVLEGVEAFESLQAQSQVGLLSTSQKQEAHAFLKNLGQALYQALLPTPLRQSLNPHAALLLDMQQVQFSTLPWELLHDGDGWLALRQGVLRIETCHQPMGQALAEGGGGLHTLALGAQPLWQEPTKPLKHRGQVQTLDLGQPASPFEPPVQRVWPAFCYLPQTTWSQTTWPQTTLPSTSDHAGPHASGGLQMGVIAHGQQKDLEQAWHAGIEALLLVAECTETGWWLENPRGEKTLFSRSFLLELLRRTPAGNTPLLALMDGYAHSQPQQAAALDAALIKAGAPAVLRPPITMHHQALQAFLHQVFLRLSQGDPFAQAYRTALRQLADANTLDWLWHMPKLHLAWNAQSQPSPTHNPLAPRPKNQATAAHTTATHPAPPKPMPWHAQLDPTFRPSWQPSASNPARPQWVQRVLHLLQPSSFTPPALALPAEAAPTHQALPALIRSHTAPESNAPISHRPLVSPSPFLCVSAPPGAGKTQLLAQVCQRLGRMLDEVVWLYPHDIAQAHQAWEGPNQLPTSTSSTDRAQADARATLRALAMRLLLQPQRGSSVQTLATQLAMHCADGKRRVLVVSHLEQRPGFALWLQTLLSVLPAETQVVALCARPPKALEHIILPAPATLTPQRPLAHLALPPFTPAELGAFLGENWMYQTMRRKDSAALLRLCGLNVRLAQLLARMPNWPTSQHVFAVLKQRGLSLGHPFQPQQHIAWSKAAQQLLEHTLTMQVATVDAAGRGVLFMLGLFPAPLPQNLLANVCQLPPEALTPILRQLQTLGLLASLGPQGEVCLSPQIQAWASETLANQRLLKHLYAHAAHAFGQQLRATLQAFPVQNVAAAGGHGAWCPRPINPAKARALQRQWDMLGLCTNLTELCTLLGEAERYHALQHLATIVTPWLHSSPCTELGLVLQQQLAPCFRSSAPPSNRLKTGLDLASQLLFAQSAHQAKPTIERLLTWARKAGNWKAAWEARGLLGRLLLQVNEAEKAQPLLVESLNAALERGDTKQLVGLCQDYANAWAQQQKPLVGLQRQLTQWIAYLERQGAKQVCAEWVCILAHTYLQENRLEDALDAFEHATNTLQTLGSAQSLARSLLGQASCLHHLGKGLNAWQCLQKVLMLSNTGLLLEPCIAVLLPLAKWLEDQRELKASQEAYSLLRQWIAWLPANQHLEVLDCLGRVQHQLGQSQPAAQTYAHRLRVEAILQQTQDMAHSPAYLQQHAALGEGEGILSKGEPNPSSAA